MPQKSPYYFSTHFFLKKTNYCLDNNFVITQISWFNNKLNIKSASGVILQSKRKNADSRLKYSPATVLEKVDKNVQGLLLTTAPYARLSSNLKKQLIALKTCCEISKIYGPWHFVTSTMVNCCNLRRGVCTPRTYMRRVSVKLRKTTS